MKRLIILSFVITIIISILPAHGQRNQKGKPISLDGGITFDNIPRDSKKVKSKKYRLPIIDNNQAKVKADSIVKGNCVSCKSNAYGKGIQGRIDVKKNAEKSVLGDTLNLWLMTVESETAYGMQFYFEDFKLPSGAKLFIYNEERTEILGGFTKDNNPENQNSFIDFGTQWISGNIIHIEYQEPSKPEFKGELAIQNIVHIFSNVFEKSGPYATGDPGACQINVKCEHGADWEKEISSVALILQLDNSGDIALVSSGSLINSTSNSVIKKPLFLTARHIAPTISTWQKQYDPTTYIFLFEHEAASCQGDGSNAEEYQYSDDAVFGSYLVAGHGITAPSADFLLLELKESINWFSDRQLSFNGWSKASIQQGDLFVGVHHPKGDVKKISFSTGVNSSFYNNSTTNASGDHWRLQWQLGVTSPGSSGSPLFDENHRIVGQLHGGSSSCQNQNGFDYYGKFYTAFTTDSEFRDALDPGNSGDISVDRYTPHIDDDAFMSECVYDGEYDYNRIGTEGFFLNGESVDASCQNPIIYMSANDRLLLKTKGAKVWDLSYPEDSKFDLFPNSGNCGDDGEAYYCAGVGGIIWTCTCFWAKIHVELKEYDYYLKSSSENVLYSGEVSLGADRMDSNTGLVDSQFGGCDQYRLYIKEFYLDKYLPVSLSSNKVYSSKLKTKRTQGVQEKLVWIDTHVSGVSLSGELSHDITHKSVILENATLNSGSNVYFDSSFKIQGVSTIQPNTGIYPTDLSDECYDN